MSVGGGLPGRARGTGYVLSVVEVRLGDVRLAATKLEIGDQRRRDFAHFLDLVSEIVRRGEVTLLPHRIQTYGAPVDRGVRILVDSLAPCACLSLAELGLGLAGLLLGPIPLMRQLCSYIDPLPPQHALTESAPVRTDYRGFRPLWASPNEDVGKPEEYLN